MLALIQTMAFQLLSLRYMDIPIQYGFFFEQDIILNNSSKRIEDNYLSNILIENLSHEYLQLSYPTPFSAQLDHLHL